MAGLTTSSTLSELIVKKFGKKVSLYKNIFIAKAIKKYKPKKK